MPDDYLEDFFECIYNAELEQKQQLDSADSFLVGILAGLIGVGVYYLQLMATSEFGWATGFLWLFGIPYFAALGGGVVCMIASIRPRFKEYISSPQQWADYVAGEEEHFRFFLKEESLLHDRVAHELRSLRRQQYIQAGETNRQLIYAKHACQVWAKRFLIAAVVCMLLSGFPIYYLMQSQTRNAINERSTEPADSTATTSAPEPTAAVEPAAAPGPTHR